MIRYGKSVRNKNYWVDYDTGIIHFANHLPLGMSIIVATLQGSVTEVSF